VFNEIGYHISQVVEHMVKIMMMVMPW
jgi:hypothetical protein